MGSKRERQADRALVAAYHEARLGELVERVAGAVDRSAPVSMTPSPSTRSSISTGSRHHRRDPYPPRRRPGQDVRRPTPDARRLATLVAFATVAAQRGQDDALEHFDRLHCELQLRVRKQGERERLRDGQEIDRAGLTLADACRVLLKAPTSEPIADAVFARVDRPRLLAAVTAIERLARSPEDRARS